MEADAQSKDGDPRRRSEGRNVGARSVKDTIRIQTTETLCV